MKMTINNLFQQTILQNRSDGDNGGSGPAMAAQTKITTRRTAGWISLWRESLSHPLYPTNRNVKKEPLTPWEAWVDVLLNVAYEDHFFMYEGKQIEEKRGEWRISIRYLSERWGWGHNKLIRVLKLWQKEEMIEFLPERIPERIKGRIPGGIKVVNFNSYQDHGFKKEPQTGTHNGTHPERIRNAYNPYPEPKSEKEDHQTGTKYNKYIKEHMIKCFDRFWEEYPKKVNKKKAREKFLKLSLKEGEFEKMIEALRNQKESSQWRKNGGQYIPHPTTWLHGERWNDELEPSGDEEVDIFGERLQTFYQGERV